MRDAMSTTTNSSYDALREAIVRGDIAPEARLVESEISTNFEMSRGAVRTALIRLEEEGLVVREPHRGARVRKVSDDEAVEILQVRAVLEGLAVRLTAERIDDAGAARLEALLERHRELLEGGDLLGASDANADLHAALLELSGHGTARRLIRALNSQTVRYQYRNLKRVIEDMAVLSPEAANAGIGQTFFMGNPSSRLDAATNIQQFLFPIGGTAPAGCNSGVDPAEVD